MENRVQIRRGIGAPGFGDLLEYELGYDKTSKALYIRSGDGIEIVNSNVIQQFITDSHENGKNHVRGFIGDNWTINENATTENHNTLIHRGETGVTLDDKSYLTIRFDVGDTYVLSGYVKGTPNLVIELRSLDESEHLSWTYNVVGINYEYITEIFEIPAPGDYQLTLGGNGTETEGFYFKELQIERGEIPTDWRPAPEDVGDLLEKIKEGERGLDDLNLLIGTKVSEINLSLDGITSRVSNVETHMETVTPHHIILSNENQSIITDSTGKVTQAITVTTDIDAFKGVNRIAGTIGTPVLKNSAGATISFGTIAKTNPTINISGKVTWSIPINTNISSDSGWIEIPIVIEGKAYTKKLNWTKAKEGIKGDKGDKGTDARVVSIAPSQLYFVRKLVGGNYVVTPDTITLAPDFQNCTFSKWEYSINGTTFTQITRTSSSSTLPYYNTTSRVLTIPKGWAILENNDYVVFKITSTTGEIDVQTVSILYDVTELETRVNTAEQKITDNAIVSTVRSSTAYTNDLAAKGDKSVLDSAVSTINQHANQIALKVEQTDIDTAVEGVQDQVTGHESRIQSAEQKITPNAIVSTVTSNITGNQLTSIISQDSTTVKIKAKYIDLVGAITADSGIIQDLAIRNDLLANDISANKISSGVLEVDRLIIRSIANPERSLIYEINNIDGALQAVQGNTLNGEIFTKRSISADRIITHSITSNEIASKTITSEEIKTGTITAQSGILADAVITSAKIAEAQIDVAHLKSGFVDELLTDKIESKHIKTNSLIGTEFTATSTITVGTDDNVAVLTGQHPDYRLFVGNQDPTIAPFSVTQEGLLKAENAEIAGTIHATGGEFTGDITVGENAGISGSQIVDEGNISATRFWAGENREFEVFDDGLVKAANLYLDGNLSADNATLSGILRVGEDGILLDGNTGRLSSATYASGLSGWAIDKTGNAEFNNAKIRGQIESAIFVQNETHVVGGSMLVRPAGTLRDEIDRVDKGRNLLKNSESLFHKLGENSISIKAPEDISAETYTISFDYEISDNGGIPSTFLLYSDASITQIPLKKEGESRVSHTFVLTEARANQLIRIYFGNGSAESRLNEGTFYELKLEKGNKATDWTPAPEDNMPFDITVENPASGHYPMFNQDDILRLKNAEYDTWLTVNGVAQGEDNYTYTCSVVAGDLAFKFPEGTNIVSYGQTGSGGLIFTSEGESSPYLDIFESNDTPWNGLDMKARLGNLSGITDSEFGAIDGYGLYSDNAYLKGSILLPDAGITNVSEEGETDSPVRFWAGASFADRKNAPFRVLQDGTMYAYEGIFEGEIRGATGTFSGSIDVGNIVLDEDGIFRIKDENEENVVVGSKLGLTVYGEGFSLYPDSYSNRPYFSVAEDTNGFRLRTDRISTWKVDRDTIDTHRMVTLEGGNLDFRMLKQNLISDYSFEEGTVYGSSPVMSILPTEIGGEVIADSFTFTGMSGSPSIGIGVDEPQYPLDVDGLVNTTEGVQMGGNTGAQMVYNATENSISFVFFD